MRSRVMPGSLVTIERRVPVSRLNKVDFPTLGRPTITTEGNSSVMSAAHQFALQFLAARQQVLQLVEWKIGVNFFLQFRELLHQFATQTAKAQSCEATFRLVPGWIR